MIEVFRSAKTLAKEMGCARVVEAASAGIERLWSHGRQAAFLAACRKTASIAAAAQAAGIKPPSITGGLRRALPIEKSLRSYRRRLPEAFETKL